MVVVVVCVCVGGGGGSTCSIVLLKLIGLFSVSPKTFS